MLVPILIVVHSCACTIASQLRWAVNPSLTCHILFVESDVIDSKTGRGFQSMVLPKDKLVCIVPLRLSGYGLISYLTRELAAVNSISKCHNPWRFWI